MCAEEVGSLWVCVLKPKVWNQGCGEEHGYGHHSGRRYCQRPLDPAWCRPAITLQQLVFPLTAVFKAHKRLVVHAGPYVAFAFSNDF